MTTDRPGEAHQGDEFAPALRGAIAAQGISLDQLRKALAGHGVTVSVATLSYWQSGRSRPERATSLAAIGPLEECLHLPRGFLASRLPSPRRPQDDSYGQSSLTDERGVDDHVDRADRAAAQLGMSYHDASWVTVHDRHRLDRFRHESVQDVRLLLRAHRDGVDRFPVWFETTDASAFPIVTPVTNCRMGRVREFREFGGAVVEMYLERPLRAGETTLVEHRQTLVGPQTPRVETWRSVPSASREVVIEVQFAPEMLPLSASATSMVDGQVATTEIPVHRTIQGHFADNPPGQFRVAWVWGAGPAKDA